MWILLRASHTSKWLPAVIATYFQFPDRITAGSCFEAGHPSSSRGSALPPISKKSLFSWQWHYPRGATITLSLHQLWEALPSGQILWSVFSLYCEHRPNSTSTCTRVHGTDIFSSSVMVLWILANILTALPSIL